MATRKSASKASKKSAKGAKKAAPKKASATKKSAAKKAKPAKKRAAKAAKKKAPAKKASAAKAPATKEASATKAPASNKAKGKFSSMDVNMGHVFALRPRANTSFRQPDFRTARQQLQDEAFDSVQEAARAVAEKAIDMTHSGSLRATVKSGRR